MGIYPFVDGHVEDFDRVFGELIRVKCFFPDGTEPDQLMKNCSNGLLSRMTPIPLRRHSSLLQKN
jgi:hypothetical protein